MLLILLAALTVAPPIGEMSPAELTAYVARLPEPFETRLADVAQRSVGIPYAAGPLGEGPDGTHDKDPLADYSKVDCVTFVEQSIALAASQSYDEAFELLQRIRYRDGRVDYESRNHFMETDWFPNNPFCVEVTEEVGVPTQTVTRTISRRDFFQKVKAPEFGQNTPDREVALAYVPSSLATAAEAALPSPSLICFVGKTDWLFAIHCGMYIRDEKGQGRLYHASVPDKQVVAVPFAKYVESQSRFIGFTVHRIEDPRTFSPKP